MPLRGTWLSWPLPRLEPPERAVPVEDEGRAVESPVGRFEEEFVGPEHQLAVASDGRDPNLAALARLKGPQHFQSSLISNVPPPALCALSPPGFAEHGVVVMWRVPAGQSLVLKAASKLVWEAGKSNFFSAARASGAPWRRSMPASSHSMLMGPV